MIIAKQVPCEERMSPLDVTGWDWIGNYYESMNVFYGNDLICSPQLEKIKSIMKNYEWSFLDEDDCIEIFRDLNATTELPPMEVMELAVNNYFSKAMDDKVEACRCMIEFMTEKNYKVTRIHGCVQGEIAWCLYPTDEWSNNAIKYFEVEFFNLGDEWNVDGGYVYTHEYDTEKQRKEIAEQVGVKPSEVVLEIFTGYVKTPTYERR